MKKTIQFKRYLWLLLLAIFPACTLHQNNNSPENVTETLVSDSVLVSGLNYPWEITWGPDNFIWMTERNGKISRVDPTTGNVTRLLSVEEVIATGEGGLLGMALHPDLTAHPEVFIAYDYNSGQGYKEKVVKYLYNNNTLTNPQVLIDGINASSIHNGCRLLIGPDQKLYITTGDASHSSDAQDKNGLNGKILRLNLDGSIPSDNPFTGNPVFTYGHRNSQGLVFVGNRLYNSEHGPSNDDEINIIEKGRNYGWPDVEGYCDNRTEREFCSANNVKEPIYAWTPTAAVCGLDYYNKELIPTWKNSLLLVSLKNARLYQLKLDSAGTRFTEVNEFFKNKYGRLRDLCIAPDGTVYICTSNGGQKDVIVKIRSK
jgi:glucose/arabinose dehydrogenase